jgi:hypothetical protein
MLHQRLHQMPVRVASSGGGAAKPAAAYDDDYSYRKAPATETACLNDLAVKSCRVAGLNPVLGDVGVFASLSLM